MTDPRIEEMIQALQSLLAVLQGQRESEPLQLDVILDAHIHTRKALAATVKRLSERDLLGADQTMENAIRLVKEQIRVDLGSRVDAVHIKIRGYGPIHKLLLEYLIRNVGQNVSGDRLRAVTGDQSETERRIRELRCLGFNIVSVRKHGADQYQLMTAQQDLKGAGLAILIQTLRDHPTDFSDRECEIVRSYVALA